MKTKFGRLITALHNQLEQILQINLPTVARNLQTETPDYTYIYKHLAKLKVLHSPTLLATNVNIRECCACACSYWNNQLISMT